ncbi:dienelactone hydrolase family protein [Nocardia sp. alder85J]|uniref:dienelactone hydrolase family protein n=1 Tax=Nocardia sp. alder85J TaxID=2862949 RepID=UPI001CD521B2|nr:dienelactone hydrolase family protein [Nocardia sp. alder85J]MCX4092786.1 dienelactone hydrolase family protein [Nocardia sp. alder85J]
MTDEYESEQVRIAVGTGVMGGYLARPSAPGRYPGVLLAHQLFGVTADIRGFADRLAGLGYVALAPDFYHRSASGVELPTTDEGRERGFALMKEMTRDGVLADMRAAAAHLGGRAEVRTVTGVLGVSLGGHLAYLAATRLAVPVTLVLYAGWLTGTEIPVSTPEPTLDLTGGITGRVVYVVGERDHVVPAADRDRIADRLAAAGVSHEVVVVPGVPQ